MSILRRKNENDKSSLKRSIIFTLVKIPPTTTKKKHRVSIALDNETSPSENCVQTVIMQIVKKHSINCVVIIINVHRYGIKNSVKKKKKKRIFTCDWNLILVMKHSSRIPSRYNQKLQQMTVTIQLEIRNRSSDWSNWPIKWVKFTDLLERSLYPK